jgi:hypothetical protein
MSEFSAPVSDEQQPAVSISNRRLLIEMAVIIAISLLIGAVAVSGQFAVGVFLGGILAYLNYFWLSHSLRAMFSAVAGGQSAGLPAIRYFLRYVLLGAALLAIYLTGVGTVSGAVLGLSSFPLAVVAEGAISIFRGWFKRER